MQVLTKLIFFILLLAANHSLGQSYQIAVMKYNGGGDWYANLETSLPNLVKFTNATLNAHINPKQATVEPSSENIYKYPFVHMTGHGNVVFNNYERENLRKYMIAGGFIHIDDNYGMDKYIRVEMLKVLPELEWVTLPSSHKIFHQTFDFNYGLPKIHEHDDKPSEAFGLIYEGRLVCLYTYESDLGDGWESPEVHNDSPEKRKQALQMGCNILEYVFTQTTLYK